MKTQHTPGPWHVERDNGIYAKDQYIGLSLKGFTYDKGLPYKANAKLMAASPKMYEFIEKLATTQIPTGVAHSAISTSILHAIVDSAKNLTKEIKGDESNT